MVGYEEHIREGKGRTDITPIFSDPDVFSNLITDLLNLHEGYEKIAGIESLGFVLASAMAERVKKPLMLVRKAGNLPNAIQESCIDYTGEEKTLEVSSDFVKRGEKVLLVDDWIETGAQASAAIRLIERTGAEVVGVCAFTAEKAALRELEQYDIRSLRIEDA